MMNGIINVYKETGYTSHDVVAKMRGICKQKKIGHTGTLDPEATGVLPVCLGTGTKLCDMLTDKEKEYVTELLLGVETDTQDMTGTVLRESKVDVTAEQVEKVIKGFEGTYDQIPPMYSALKVNGKKLYELARNGIEVERKARPVTIREIEILEIRLPFIRMRVVCSKGTYIRTLCSDIGSRLGCGAAMQTLERTRVGKFRVENAYTLAQIEKIRDEEGLEQILFPVESAFDGTDRLCVIASCDKLLRNGNKIPEDGIGKRVHEEDKLNDNGCIVADNDRFHVAAKDMSEGSGRSKLVRMCTSNGEFLGVYEYDYAQQNYMPVKMFLEQ